MSSYDGLPVAPKPLDKQKAGVSFKAEAGPDRKEEMGEGRRLLWIIPLGIVLAFLPATFVALIFPEWPFPLQAILIAGIWFAVAAIYKKRTGRDFGE